MAIFTVNPNGRAPEGLVPGDHVITRGGVYEIMGFAADGSYKSEKVSDATTYAEFLTGVRREDYPETQEGQKQYVRAIAKAAGHTYRDDKGRLVCPWEEAEEDA